MGSELPLGWAPALSSGEKGTPLFVGIPMVGCSAGVEVSEGVRVMRGKGTSNRFLRTRRLTVYVNR